MGRPSPAHSPSCPQAAPQPRCTSTCSAQRRALSHRRPQRLRAAAVETRDEQDTSLDSVPSTSYGNGAASKEDLTYAMDHASSDMLYKRFFELLDGDFTDLKEGDTVQGAILSVSERGAYVELGRKGPAYCHSNEMTLAKGVKAHEIVQPNTVRDFVVSDIFGNGDVLVSMVEAELGVMWLRLQQLQEAGITVQATGTSTNQNGLVVSVHGVSGFLPKRFMDRSQEPDELIGKELQVKILEANQENERLIVAQKMMLAGTAEGGDMEFKVGDVVEGKIVSLQPYGAFINCGGLNDGLLHVSQISHDRVSNLEAIFSVGDSIKVMVLTHEKSKGRLNLTTKKLEPNPGDMLRNPKKVFEQADRMAALFKEQVKQAQELELGQNGSMDASLDADN